MLLGGQGSKVLSWNGLLAQRRGQPEKQSKTLQIFTSTQYFHLSESRQNLAGRCQSEGICFTHWLGYLEHLLLSFAKTMELASSSGRTEELALQACVLCLSFSSV